MDTIDTTSTPGSNAEPNSQGVWQEVLPLVYIFFAVLCLFCISIPVMHDVIIRMVRPQSRQHLTLLTAVHAMCGLGLLLGFLGDIIESSAASRNSDEDGARVTTATTVAILRVVGGGLGQGMFGVFLLYAANPLLERGRIWKWLQQAVIAGSAMQALELLGLMALLVPVAEETHRNLVWTRVQIAFQALVMAVAGIYMVVGGRPLLAHFYPTPTISPPSATSTSMDTLRTQQQQQQQQHQHQSSQPESTQQQPNPEADARVQLLKAIRHRMAVNTFTSSACLLLGTSFLIAAQVAYLPLYVLLLPARSLQVLSLALLIRLRYIYNDWIAARDGGKYVISRGFAIVQTEISHIEAT